MEEVKEVNVALEEITEVAETEVKEVIEENEISVSVEEDCEGFEEEE